MLKTRQKIYKVSANNSTPKSKKEEIISQMREKINITLKNLSSNFYQQTVKEELDKIKENYIPKPHPEEDYKIKPGEIEYKSTYPNIFNDEIKYGILADIRDSSNERIDKIEDIIERLYKRIDNIKDNLKINNKNINRIKQKKLYEKMISYNSSFNNNNEENNVNIIVDGNITFTNDNIQEKNINEVKNLNVSKGSLGTSCSSEKKKINVKLNIESDNEVNDGHSKNLNSESSILSTDRKSKGSFINVNYSKK